jgi:hypothetical protein
VIGDTICRCRVRLLVRLIGVAGEATLAANIDASASAVARIVLEKSQNALRVICRKKTKQVTIADQCALKRTTEVAREFIASWCGPPHDYLIAVPTARKNYV